MIRKNEKKNLKKIYPFSKEEEKQLKEKPLKDMKELLEMLDTWRRDSLLSSLRF